MQSVCAFKPASTPCLLTNEFRPIRRVLPRAAAREGIDTSATRLNYSQTAIEPSPPPMESISLWSLVLGFRDESAKRQKTIEEEYGPYAFEVLMPSPAKDKPMYVSHICERLAMEGSNEAGH
eukprot:gene20950-27802_t